MPQISSQGNLSLPCPLSHGKKSRRKRVEEYEALARTRLSKNFILRDFLFSTESASLGLSNFPERPDLVIAAGRALCENVLEPTLTRFGRFAIIFGYQCRVAIDAEDSSPRTSNPHMWDRRTFGDQPFARVDILPFCVEDGEVSRYDFAHWMMHELDLDLLMQFKRSNVYCITISPLPRRVWLEWGRPSLGEKRQQVFMGLDYWRKLYPSLPDSQRPKFGPSCTGGSMQWRGNK